MRASTSWRITAPLRAAARAVRSLVRTTRDVPRENVTYQQWVSENDGLSERDCELIRSHIASFDRRPRLSIVTPVCDTPLRPLSQAIESVKSQLYPDWELCVVGDASSAAGVRDALRQCADADPRIKVSFWDGSVEISVRGNTSLEMATGDWIVLMSPDGVLAPHALYLIADAVNRIPDAAIVYSDEDQIDGDGQRSNPYFKPDWDYDLFLGKNLIGQLGAYRADLVRKAGGFRKGFMGAHHWEFALRVLETAEGATVYHVPFVLYHCRCASSQPSSASLQRAVESGQRAVNEHLQRTGQVANATPFKCSYLRIARGLPAAHPLVSVIIPTRDKHELLRTCLAGLFDRTRYKPFEIVIVDNGTSDPDSVRFLTDVRTRPGVTVLQDNRAFNFSRLINQGVAASAGEVCVLLNNDVDVINEDWLDELVAQAIRPEVGAVGAKLYYADDTLQHGGVILGVGGVASHQHKSVPREAHGYFGRLQLTHSLSCVTAACLAVRRSVFLEAGGFDEDHLTVAFNDVDFCIRVREAGYKIIWTPHAELYHYESLSRGSDLTRKKLRRFTSECDYMKTKWSRILLTDPYYNPNLSLYSDHFEITAWSRIRKPWIDLHSGLIS